MAEEGFKLKLSSIFSADAVGYRRLMEDDEEATGISREVEKAIIPKTEVKKTIVPCFALSMKPENTCLEKSEKEKPSAVRK
jgi:hypothetical protein